MRLKEEEKQREYKRKIEQKIRGMDWEERQDSTEWTKIQEAVMEVAEEVCGVRSKSVENP